MSWVTTGQKQRSRWAARVAGYDAATKKAAVANHRAVLDGRVGSDDVAEAQGRGARFQLSTLCECS